MKTLPSLQSPSSFPVFHVLFEAGRNNDFEAMADTIADD
jgi:hypothetical protein